jgi:Xaa-Pro aminopeptidase
MPRILDTARNRGPAAGDDTLPVDPMPLGLDIVARRAAIDERRLGLDRLAKVRAELSEFDYAAALLSDPINIRYATGSRNMAVWTLHAPGRYVFVPVDGPVVLFEYGTPSQMEAQGVFDLATVDEVRPAIAWFYFSSGPRTPEKAQLWATEIIGLMREHGGANRRLAVDRCEPWGAQLLIDAGIRLFDAQEPMELARTVKTPEELKCLQLSVDVCDIAIERIRQALRPGISENQLYSLLHEINIAHDGEWVECRLLTSGERTNPWYQEASNRIIQPGDIVAFDTDMVGPYGYLADLSRTWVCPGRKPTAEQRRLYEIAQEQVLFNLELLKPGLSFQEFSERCWPIPDEFVPNRYAMTLHGSGMVDEYPNVAHLVDWEANGWDGMFEENMVLSVESYIGEVGGKEGVKLEQQVVLTSTGAELMSKEPFVDALEI